MTPTLPSFVKGRLGPHFLGCSLSGKRPGLDCSRTPTPPHRTQHAPFRCTTLSKSPFARFSVWQICHVRQFQAVILSSMDFSMTHLTDRDLFSVEHPQNAVKACGLPLIGELPNMTDVMHFNLHFVQCF